MTSPSFCKIQKNFECTSSTSSPNFQTQGCFIRIKNSGKLSTVSDILTSHSIADSRTQKPWVFCYRLALNNPKIFPKVRAYLRSSHQIFQVATFFPERSIASNSPQMDQTKRRQAKTRQRRELSPTSNSISNNLTANWSHYALKFCINGRGHSGRFFTFYPFQAID